MVIEAAVVDRNNWLDDVAALDRHERASALPRAAACGERDAGVSRYHVYETAPARYISPKGSQSSKEWRSAEESKKVEDVAGIWRCGGAKKQPRRGNEALQDRRGRSVGRRDSGRCQRSWPVSLQSLGDFWGDSQRQVARPTAAVASELPQAGMPQRTLLHASAGRRIGGAHPEWVADANAKCGSGGLW